MRTIVFDLDDTLAPSKSPMEPEMARLMRQLLAVTEVCIISGGAYEQFTAQVLDRLGADVRLDRLHLMPTCGTTYFRWNQAEGWVQQYKHDLTADQSAHAQTVLEEGARGLGLWEEQTWGLVIEDRGSQVTFSALGQQAPVEAKKAWDPTGAKKESLRRYAADRLPDLEVRSGGSTSVDITRKGIDKAYGIRSLCEHNGLTLADLVFVGDRLDEGGNDYPVKAMGVECVSVDGWKETAAYVSELLLQTRENSPQPGPDHDTGGGR